MTDWARLSLRLESACLGHRLEDLEPVERWVHIEIIDMFDRNYKQLNDLCIIKNNIIYYPFDLSIFFKKSISIVCTRYEFLMSKFYKKIFFY